MPSPSLQSAGSLLEKLRTADEAFAAFPMIVVEDATPALLAHFTRSTATLYALA